MKKVSIDKRLTRHSLANPFQNESMQERLRKVSAIDLRGNFKISKLDTGYHQIEPIDRNKRF